MFSSLHHRAGQALLLNDRQFLKLLPWSVTTWDDLPYPPTLATLVTRVKLFIGYKASSHGRRKANPLPIWLCWGLNLGLRAALPLRCSPHPALSDN